MEKQCGVDCACVVQGTHIDRREFLAKSGMTALAAALAACGLSNSPTAPGSLSQPVTITLSDHPSLANVDGVAFVSDTNGNPLAVVRTATSTFGGLPQTLRQSVTISPVMNMPQSSITTDNTCVSKNNR